MSFNVDAFFGNDPRGRTFAGANYTGTNYALRSHNSPDELKGTLLDLIMREELSGRGGEGLNKDMVNFVVATALFHRNLDPSTNRGDADKEIYAKVKESVDREYDGAMDIVGAKIWTEVSSDSAGSTTVSHYDTERDTAINTIVKAVADNVSKNALSGGMSEGDAQSQIVKLGDKLKTTVSNLIGQAISVAGQPGASEDSTKAALKRRDNKESLTKALSGHVVNALFSSTHIGSDKGSKMIDNIYSNWDKDSSPQANDVRKFYKTFVNVLQKVGSEWSNDPVDENDYHTLASGPDVRVNLKKVLEGPNTGAPLFSETLPLVRTGVKANYSDHSNKNRQVQVNDTKFLTKVYIEVYRDGKTKMLPQHSTDALHLSGSFIPTKEMVKEMLAATADPTPASREKPVPGVSIDDYEGFFNELSTGKVWRRDSSGLYREAPDGTKVYASPDNVNDKCESAGLKNDANCGTILECLMDGENKNLGRCLEVFKNANMWKQAKADVDSVHPHMAIYVLKKLGVKGVRATTSTGQRIIVPMSFEKWFNTKLSEEERKAIGDNEPLQNYIKGLIKVLTEEPKILNKHLTDEKLGGVPTSLPAEVQRLKLRQFQEPVERKASMKYSAQLLRNMHNMVPRIGVEYPGNRVTAVDNIRLGVGMLGGNMAGGCMHGGVRPAEFKEVLNNRANDSTITCSSSHRLMLENLRRELESVGHRVSDADLTRINKAIDRMADLEGKLGKLHDHLSKFVEFGRVFGIDYDSNPGMGLKEVNIEEVRDEDGLMRYLATNTQEMKRCINNNMQLQNGINNELITKIYSQLLEKGSGSSAGESELRY